MTREIKKSDGEAKAKGSHCFRFGANADTRTGACPRPGPCWFPEETTRARRVSRRLRGAPFHTGADSTRLPRATVARRSGGAGMKAAVLYKANTPLDVVDVEQQGPQAGEARVRVMATGVCHSDWHIINGDWTLPLPMVLGHEAAGVVEEVGPGVSNVRRGDHIIFSFRPHCGRCFYCSSGRSILCDGYASARFVMLDGTHRLRRNGQDINQMARLGTFAESVVCPAEMLVRSEEHTSELQSLAYLVCRLLLEKKKKNTHY